MISFLGFKESHFIFSATELEVYSAKYINHQERASINYYRISKVPFVIPENFLPFWGSSKETLVMMPLATSKKKKKKKIQSQTDLNWNDDEVFLISTISKVEYLQDWLIGWLSEIINTWVLFIFLFCHFHIFSSKLIHFMI